MKNRIKIRQFTLIELMVVIVIIAILAGLLLSALNGARKKVKRTDCMNNLRQFGIGIMSYQNDFHDRFPPWISTLYPNYVSSTKIYRCREDRNPPDTLPENWISHPLGHFSEAYDRPGSKSFYDPSGNNPNPAVTKISYFYEFSEAPCSWKGNTASWNEVKMQSIRSEVNPYTDSPFSKALSFFPVLRCGWHMDNQEQPYLNVSLSGNCFYSSMEWEKAVWKP